MCLVVAAVDSSPRYPLMFAANRDERHARPTAYASWWEPERAILGGKDLVAGGSWLAVDRSGRLAAVTNYRDVSPSAAPRSRGTLVAEFLAGSAPAPEFGAALEETATRYGPFSLLLFEGGVLHYFSNRAPAARLARGIHALSNAAYGVEWPKVRSATAGMKRLIASGDPLEGLFELLAERSDAPSAEERYRAAHFVQGEIYGTRCSTVVLLDGSGTLTFAERSFDSAGRRTHDVRESFATGNASGLRARVGDAR
jgi:uncharacterized protein with NRDE domain